MIIGALVSVAAPLAAARTIVLTFPAYSGPVIESGFPAPVTTVGQQWLDLPAGEAITAATISGSWGNMEWPQGTAGVDVMLEGLRVARCVKPDPNCWGPTPGQIPWSRQLSLAERMALKPGTISLAAMQTSDTRLRLGQTTLTITTSPGRVEKPAHFDGMWTSAVSSELGWGINFAQQDDMLFATWYTYGGDGRAWWLAASLQQLTPDGPFEGTAYATNGPPFDAAFSSGTVVPSEIGVMRVSFAGADEGVFDYTVAGVMRSQPIRRQVFGPVPDCTWSTQAELAAARNYQGLWWNAPAQSEPGWGVSFTHQGNTIYATWFTYDERGKPWWLAAVMQPQIGVGLMYGGDLYAFDGPPLGSKFDSARVSGNLVGDATVWLADGNRGVFTTTVGGYTQSKRIERQIWGPPGSGTVCR